MVKNGDMVISVVTRGVSLEERFGLSHEEFHNPMRKRVDVNININISSLTRAVMKGTQLHRA